MIKNYFLSFCLLSAVAAGAQITVTSSDMPNPGDSIKVSQATTTGGVDHTLTGANYNWDFSSLVPNIQRYVKFDAPSTFPTPYNLLFSAFNTSYGQRNYQNVGSPLPGFTIEADYDFFRESSNCFRQNGIGYILNGIPIPMTYSRPDSIYDFPVNYADTMSCNFKFSTPSFAAVPFYYGENGHRESVVDGWGSLTTPYGTFPVLRIRSVITATDSIYLDTLGFGIAIPVPTRIEYKWLATAQKIPLLEIDASALGATETVTGIVYRDSIRPEIPQVGIAEFSQSSDFSIYPNPANNELFVQFSATNSSKTNIRILNALGQTIAVVAEGVSFSGKQSMRIDLAGLDLNAGLYFVSFENGTVRETKRVVITK